MTSENKRLLQAAFEAQRKDHNMGYRRVQRDPIRGIPGTGETSEIFSSKGTPFTYNGPLPPGIRELGRTDSWDFGPGEPFLNFDEPMDFAAMTEAVKACFGSSVEIKQRRPYIQKRVGREDVAYHGNDVNRGDHTLLIFYDMPLATKESTDVRKTEYLLGTRIPIVTKEPTRSVGRINYYTDGPTEADEKERELVIITIEKYLELKGH